VTAEQGGDYCRGRVCGGGDVDVLSNRTVSGAVAVSSSVATARRRSATGTRQRRGERAGGPEPEHVPTAPASSAPAPAAPTDAATTRAGVVVAVVTVVDATTPGPAELAESAPELRRHQVVQDRVDGRVQIDHDPGRVQYDVVVLEAQVQERVLGH